MIRHGGNIQSGREIIHIPWIKGVISFFKNVLRHCGQLGAGQRCRIKKESAVQDRTGGKIDCCGSFLIRLCWKPHHKISEAVNISFDRCIHNFDSLVNVEILINQLL